MTSLSTESPSVGSPWERAEFFDFQRSFYVSRECTVGKMSNKLCCSDDFLSIGRFSSGES